MVFHLPTRKSSREVILMMTQKFTHYSNNVSTPYGGTTVYRRIPYLPGYPYCHNIRSIEVTVIKITIYEDWTILGIYRSPKEPVRKLCPVISEIWNGTLKDNIIVKTFSINGLTETETRPLRNLIVRGKHYKQWIPSYTNDHKTVLDQIYRNISHLHVDIQTNVLETYFTDHRAVWASFHAIQ